MNTRGKTSSTMRFLERHEVFSLAEFMEEVDPSVSERTRYTNLSNAVGRGQAYSVKRGLYASNLGPYRDRVPNVFLVAAKAAQDAVVSHHSALELHGVAHAPLRTVYFTSEHRLAEFGVRGYRFVRMAPHFPAAADPATALITRLRSGDALVPATTRERTLVDCMSDLVAAGGLEELLRSLGGFSSMSVDTVVEYLWRFDSPTLTARVGWLLELFASFWDVDEAPLEALRRTLGRGTYWLTRGEDSEFIARWRLYVPRGMPYELWVTG